MTVLLSGSESPAEQPEGRGWPAGLAETGARGGDLAIWTDQSANRCTLRLRGRLCADTVAILDRHVDRLGCRWCDEVVVDLDTLLRIDPVGARLLVGLGHYVAGRGGRFHVRNASPRVEEMLEAAEAEIGA